MYKHNSGMSEQCQQQIHAPCALAASPSCGEESLLFSWQTSRADVPHSRSQYILKPLHSADTIPHSHVYYTRTPHAPNMTHWPTDALKGILLSGLYWSQIKRWNKDVSIRCVRDKQSGLLPLNKEICINKTHLSTTLITVLIQHKKASLIIWGKFGV